MRSLSIAFLFLLTRMLAAQTWQWSQQIGGPGASEAVKLIGTDTEMSVFVYGGFSSNSDLYIGQDTLHGANGSSFLAKFTSNGDVVWLRQFRASPYGVILDTMSSKLYMVGVYIGSCTLDTCVLSTSLYTAGFVSQWNLDGHCLWAKNVVESGADLANHFCTASAVSVDDEGRVILGGTTTPYGPNYLAGNLVPQGTFMAAYNTQGDTLWTRMIAWYQGDMVGFTPVCSRPWDGHVFVSNAIYLHTASDTVTVDTVVFTGAQGAALALMRIDPVDGSMDWIEANGFPYVGPNRSFPNHLQVDSTGHVLVCGGFGNGSVFGMDTLSTFNSTVGGGYIAEFNSDGDLLWVRSYAATGGCFFAEMCLRPDGRSDVTGWIGGTATWDNVSHTAEAQSVLLASFSPTGQCLGLEGDVGPAKGSSITLAPDGLYLAGTFPPYSPPIPPILPITIGASTYNTFGGQDAFLAKHSLNVGVGIPSYRSVEADGLHIYANPNRGSFRLEMPDAFANERDLVLRIYDAMGRLVHEQPLDLSASGTPKVDVFDASPGLYSVTLSNGSKMCSGSMVVE